METYTWLIILVAWGVLLALGLAGGDPLAAGRPGQEAPLVAAYRWLRRGRRSTRPAASPALTAPKRVHESGLHPAL